MTGACGAGAGQGGSADELRPWLLAQNDGRLAHARAQQFGLKPLARLGERRELARPVRKTGSRLGTKSRAPTPDQGQASGVGVSVRVVQPGTGD